MPWYPCMVVALVLLPLHMETPVSVLVPFSADGLWLVIDLCLDLAE